MRIISIVLVCQFLVLSTNAFNYGFHQDVTKQAMRFSGFSETSSKILALGDSLVDYFNYISIKSINFSQFHADNLIDRDAVVRYWITYASNAKTAITDLVSDSSIEKRELKVLTLIAISLHSIQDFYAHSNWPEVHPRLCSCYRVETLFQYIRNNISASLPNFISTGKGSSYEGTFDGAIHGNACEGRNKDSYVRPLWEETYVYAYIASIEWVNIIRNWINDDSFWTTLQTFDDYDDLEDDIYLTSRTFWSLLSKPEFQDSIYKGPGSGDLLGFAYYLMKYMSNKDSDMVKLLRNDKIYEKLTTTNFYYNSLDINDPQYVSLFPALNDTIEYAPIFSQAIVLYIINASKIDSDGSKLYARFKVNSIQNSLLDAEFLKNFQTRDSSIRGLSDENSATPWTNIIFVPDDQTVLEIELEIWEDARYGEGKQLDLISDSDSKTLKFTYNVTSGAIRGGALGSGNATVTSKGDEDGNSAQIRFFIQTREVIQNNSYYGPGSCRAYTLQECFTGLQNIGEPYLCTDDGKKELDRLFASGLVAIFLPTAIILILLLTLPIIFCKVKHRCCFKKKYSKEFELDDF